MIWWLFCAAVGKATVGKLYTGYPQDNTPTDLARIPTGPRTFVREARPTIAKVVACGQPNMRGDPCPLSRGRGLVGRVEHAGNQGFRFLDSPFLAKL